MNTTKWGPHFWPFLNGICKKYTIDKRDLYEDFFLSLRDILPCIYCRISYSQYIQEIPISKYLDSCTKCMEWIYHLHNKVNDKLEKQGYRVVRCKGLKHFKNELKSFNPDKTFTTAFWMVLFTTAFTYEPYKRRSYIKFIFLLTKILPICKLKVKFRKYVYAKHKKLFKSLGDKEDYIKFIYNIYKYVKEKPISYNDMYNYMYSMKAKCGKVGKKGPTCRLPIR